MKRDLELVRLILQTLEGNQEARTASTERYSTAERAYHVALMKDAGLIEGIVNLDADGNPFGYHVSRMTWAGHDFLDAARDDTLWKKATEYVLKPGVSWSFDLLKEWLKHEARQRLGLPTSE